MPGTNYLFYLPVELWLNIAEFLSTPSLAAFCGVSKTAYDIATPVLYSPAGHGVEEELQDIIDWATRNAHPQIMARALPKLLRCISSGPSSGYMALLAAAGAGFTDIVRILLENGVSTEPPEGLPESNSFRTGTAITEAVLACRSEVVTILIAAGADLSWYSFKDRARLLCDGERFDPDIASALVSHGLDIHSSDPSTGGNLLHYACDNLSISRVQFLLDRGLDPNSVDQRLSTPLGIAIEASRPGFLDAHAVVELLLKGGARVNVPCHPDGSHPLHRAVIVAHAKIVELLLENGADVDTLRPDGRTALGSLAGISRFHIWTDVKENMHEIAKRLLNAGASITKNKRHFRQLMRTVAELGNPDFSKLLLLAWQTQVPNTLSFEDLSVSVAATGDAQLLSQTLREMHRSDRDIGVGEVATPRIVTPLIAAVKSRKEEAIEVAAAFESHMDVRDSWGRTALHESLSYGCERTIRLLLPKTHDITHKDRWGETPLVTAVLHQSSIVLGLILGRIHDDVMGKEMSKLRMSRQNYARDWPYDKMLSKVSHALNAAARYNKLAALRVLLNYTDRYILTLTGDCEALLIAIIEGHEEAALTMISHGKLLKEPKARGKAMALAAIYGRSSIVKALLQQKVYLDLQSQAGRAAFTFAHERGCQEIIQLLLTAEAATVSAWPGDTSPTKSTLWLLHSATCYGCVDVLAKLIPRRVSSTYKVYLEELLFLAATNNQPGPVNFLLQWGMSVDYRGHRGRTMLSHAMEHSAEKSAQALISAGCDLFALDDDLKTPLHYAPNDKMVRLINSAREKSLK